MDRALLVTRADKGSIQLLQPSGELTIACQRGFSDEFVEHFGTVTIGDCSACARAMRARATVVIEDVRVDEGYADHRVIASRAGFRAVTATKPHPAEVLSLEDCARDTEVLLEWASY